MPLEIRLRPRLSHKLRLTPQIKLALNLLHLPLAQLKEYLKEEIEKNPLLELCPDPNPSKDKLDKLLTDIADRENREYESDTTWHEENGDKEQNGENRIAASPTLQEHLLRQLRLYTGPDGERKIGESIIGNIDDNGYLDCSLDDIAQSNDTTIARTEKVLAVIQTFDPIGTGARDLRECLWLQLKAKREENSLAGRIVDKHLLFLEKKNYAYIAERLKCSVETIKDAVKEIARLQPKPGSSFNREITQRLIPDAVLRKNKDGYEVALNDWCLPRFGINAKYKALLSKAGANEETKEYLRERIRAGRSLIEAVNKRRETIRKIMEEIVYTQKGFLDEGEQHFKPLTISEIAKRIDKNKSTVSRAIANKYIETPYGTVGLREFINSGVKQENGELISSKTIKAKIKNITANELKKNPLSDRRISCRLKQEGIKISRRTIAKYRRQLKVPAARLRKD